MRFVLSIGILTLAACTGGAADISAGTTSTQTLTDVSPIDEPPTSSETPVVPDGPLPLEAAEAVDDLLSGVLLAEWEVDDVDALVAEDDIRTAWIIADLLRFYQTDSRVERLSSAFSELTGAERDNGEVEFVWATNHLISADVPAWEGYPEAKRKIFGFVNPVWDRFFEEDHGIDWRIVTWGGVFPDTRPLDETGGCERCIPALDHPETTGASEGEWYPDRDIVFGVVVDGDALALPKHQMEVHEMVHVALGGRELGIPYCTLCGSAQAYFVDNVAGIERVVLRTSGLLSRSNKLMYDLTTGSAIDTFTGEALTGQLAEEGVTLEQVSVVASTWGDWKTSHPETRIVAEDGGIGRTYVDDPLQGRDEAGPIFPVGDVDPRLLTQEKVLGVITPDGTPIAFPVREARLALAEGPVEFEGMTLRLEDSIRVYDSNGDEVVSHESFWFAWSQFHPETLLWAHPED
jgi:hypothetical protein